jgi:hypothetical protein
VDDAVFTVDLVCGFGKQFAGRLLAHDELVAIAACEQVCWVGLPIAELLNVQWSFDFGDILLDVFCQVVNANGLSDWACHFVMATTGRFNQG